MKHIDSVRINVKKQIARHVHEATRLRKILDALDSLEADPSNYAIPPIKKEKGSKLGLTKKGTPRQRVRHVRVKTTCKMCGRTFLAQRHPGGKRPVLFCHKPCNTGRYKRAEQNKQQQWKEKGVPILKGDPLTSTHPSH